MKKLFSNPSFRRFKPLACGLMLFGATLASGSASTILFYDDFSGYHGVQTGSTMGTWSLSGNTAAPEGNRRIEVLKDTQNLFGEGTDNHYLSFYTENNSQMVMRVVDAFNGGEVITLSFSLFVPEKSGYTRDIDIRAGRDIIGGNNIANRSTLKANSIDKGVFDFDTPHRVDIVFNSSTSTLTDYYQGNSLAALSFDVWVDGERLASGIKTTQAKAIADITSISFQSLSNSTLPAEFYLDWVAVSQGAAVMAPIPEPSSAFLLIPTATLACLWTLRNKAR